MRVMAFLEEPADGLLHVVHVRSGEERRDRERARQDKRREGEK